MADLNIKPEQLRFGATYLRMDATYEEGQPKHDLILVAQLCEHVANQIEGSGKKD